MRGKIGETIFFPGGTIFEHRSKTIPREEDPTGRPGFGGSQAKKVEHSMRWRRVRSGSGVIAAMRGT